MIFRLKRWETVEKLTTICPSLKHNLSLRLITALREGRSLVSQKSQKQDTLKHCWLYTRPASTTLTQH